MTSRKNKPKERKKGLVIHKGRPRSRKKIPEPITVWALVKINADVMESSIIGLYFNEWDAETDQHYQGKTTCRIEPHTVYSKERWREQYLGKIQAVEQRLKDAEYQANKEVTALRSALACGEECKTAID